MLSLIYAWIKGIVNNGEAGDLTRHRAHNDVIVMCQQILSSSALHMMFITPIFNSKCTAAHYYHGMGNTALLVNMYRVYE